MKKSQKRWIALQIAAPALIAFGIGLYYYIKNYNYLYSNGLLGPLATLSLTVFAAYALTLYPKTLMLLNTRSPSELRQLNWTKTLLIYIPIALLVLAIIAGWLYFSQATIKWAASEYYPGLTGLMFVLAFLMLLQEVMKYLDRRKGLKNYLHPRSRNRVELKFSSPILKLLIVAQSLAFLLTVWFGFTIVTALVIFLARVFLPPAMVMLTILFLYIPVIIIAGKMELKLEKWGRDHLYIPWSSH